jgi:hypothetical protein
MTVFYEYTKPFSHNSLVNGLVWDKQTLLLNFKLQSKKKLQMTLFFMHMQYMVGYLMIRCENDTKYLIRSKTNSCICNTELVI